MKMTVPVSGLAQLLDLPAGVDVTAVDAGDGEIDLTLSGVEWETPRKGRRKGAAPDVITADYSVDAHGHRTFNTFKLPGDDSTGIAPAAEDQNTPNEEE